MASAGILLLLESFFSLRYVLEDNLVVKVKCKANSKV
jgi:hypothetical protein